MNVDVDTAPLIINYYDFIVKKLKFLTISLNNTVAVVANISKQLSARAGREADH